MLQRRLAARQQVMSYQPPNPALIKRADDGVRAVWSACQDHYLASRHPELGEDPWATDSKAATAPASETSAAAPAPTSDAPPTSDAVAPAEPVADATWPEPARELEPATEPSAEPPPPAKLSPAQRKAAAEREAKRKQLTEEREAKRKEDRAKRKAEKEERERQATAAAEEVSKAYCGPEPERSAWDGIYEGVERYFKEIANDPDSVDFAGCTGVIRKGPPACWVTACNVRAKNAFGAKILKAVVFAKSSRGWKMLADR
jgi:hypothetical protein